jgi:hypothetical protein
MDGLCCQVFAMVAHPDAGVPRTPLGARSEPPILDQNETAAGGGVRANLEAADPDEVKMGPRFD